MSEPYENPFWDFRRNCNMSEMNTASTLADNESSSEGQSGLKRSNIL